MRVAGLAGWLLQVMDKEAKKGHDELLARIDRVIYHGRKANKSGAPRSVYDPHAAVAAAADGMPLMDRVASIISAVHTSPDAPVHTVAQLTHAQPGLIQKVRLPPASRIIDMAATRAAP